MDYLRLLDESYAARKATIDPESTKYEFLASIFGIYTYSAKADKFFVKKALSVCDAITNGKTYRFTSKSKTNYRWYLAIVNLPFFRSKINWGGSIRGAFWQSVGLDLEPMFWPATYEDKPVNEVYLTVDDWVDFLKAVKFFLGKKS